MPLQIGAEVFKWLQGLALVKEARRNQNNLMEINQNESEKLMDGFVFAVIFRSILKNKNDEEKLKKLDALKDNSTPAIRLYNWGIIAEMLKQIGYNLQQAEKSKITNYEPQPLAKILTFLTELKAKDPTLKEPTQNALKVDIAEISKKSIKDATNALQFLTICISKHFKISPQQTLNLFLDNNKYLSHLLAKGVKNSFQPILNLLAELRTQAEFVVVRLFCLDEKQNVNFLFNALRTCFISKEQTVAESCCLFFEEVYNQYRIGNINVQAIRNWLKDEGINTLFFCMKKHPALSSLVIKICFDYLDDEFFNYVHLSQKSILWSSDLQRLVFFKTFAQQAEQQILNRFSITPHFEQWNKLFVKTMKKTKEKQQILLLIAIMEEEWIKLKNIFEASELGLPNQYINFLKGALMTESDLLFLQATRTLFSLMQSLGSVKNAFAPLIYKILISGFSTFNDISKIVFMSDNFIESYRGISSLPGAVLVQPLLNHLQSNREWSVIQLAGVVIQEKRIDQQASLDLLEMMTKIAFSDIRFGSIILDVIFKCVQFLGEDNLSGFLQNNANLCLAQLYSHSKGISKSLKYLKQEAERMKGSDENKKAVQIFIAAASQHILCKNIVGFIAKAIIKDSILKDNLEPSIFHTFIKIKVQLKKLEQAELLRPIMASYYPEEDELQAKIQEYMKEAYPPKAQTQLIPKPRGHGHTHNHLSRSVTVRPSTTEQIQNEKTVVVLDPSQLKPSNFAIKDLQKLKQKRYQLKTIEVEREKLKALKEQKLQKFKTIQHEKRLVESMTSIQNDVQYSHIQTIETKHTVEPQTHNQNKQMIHNVNNLKLLDLQKEEEDAYRQDVESIIKRYKKVWRYLFFKYSIKKTETAGEDKVHMGEAWKMLKDYDCNFIKKEDSFTVVRLINEGLKRKNDIQYLTYEGFQNFLLQVSVIGYGKLGYLHLPPGKHLLMFVQQLKKITKQKSGSIQIFQNPQQAYFQQTEVIRQFNKRLKENPDYILPEGYKRIKQTSLQFQYDIHPMMQKNISSSYVDVLEVLDNIIFKHSSLAFHIIEPLSIKSETYLAKPFLFQSISQRMKDYSKGYLQPKKTIAPEKDILGLPSPPRKKDFKPYINFSLGIKMGIAETSLKNKSIAEQVAYCMEDILNAIENQSPVVKKGNRRKITNEFLRRKRADQLRVQSERKKDEVNWKKRAESVKLEVEVLRQKRKLAEKQKKKKQYFQKKVKKEKEERLYKEKMTQFQKVKAQIAEKKEALLQLKQQQEQKIRQEKEEYKQGVQEYFRKKKQQLKEKEEQYKKKKQQQKYKKQEAEQLKKQFVKKLYLANLKKEQQVLEKVDEIKQTYDDVWKSTQIQEVLTTHKKSLKLLFDLLLKYQKSKISATNYDQIGLATLNFFCLKFKIVPFMLQKQDINKLFVFATKNDEDRKASRKGIDFQKFQEIIFLIATKGKKTLNKMAEKRKKKEKKIQAFLNAQKSAGGNHYEAEDVSDSSSSSSEESSDQEEPTLQDEYLFNAEDVSQDTLSQVFAFLRLPSQKQEMEQRYKQALQVKTSKPRSLLIKEIKQSLEQ